MKNIKFRLTVLNFLEFFVWGAWLLSFGKYLMGTLNLSGQQVGLVFMTLGFSSIIMPGIMGIIADKYTGPNKLFGIIHILGAFVLILLGFQKTFTGVFWITLLYLMLYMPTIALNNSISYCILEKNGFDVVKTFPPIRVWGTIGFIIATWITDLAGWGLSANQFYFAAVSSLILGLYTFSLPDCPPEGKAQKKTLAQALGLDAFVLFKDSKMAVFFIFSLLLGASLQITNMWGERFLDSFKHIQEYADTFVVKRNGIVMSLSQISETLFILTIPFFLKKLGIKKVMLMSMFAWFFRFGLFAVGSPVGWGIVAILLSNIVYGMAFDFFNISGSLFVEIETEPKIRASAQGLFLIMTNGLGAMLGAYGSGFVVDKFTSNGITNWTSTWAIFSTYALIIGVLFIFAFKYKHDPKLMEEKLSKMSH